MSAIPLLPSNSASGRGAAHIWFEDNLAKLTRHCRAFVRRLPRRMREEAEAEILASIFRYVLGAERRGKLSLLTPFTLVRFFGRAFCSGRRFGGSSTTDVLSEGAQRRRKLRVVSLESFDWEARDGEVVRLSDALANPKADRPSENVRRNLDYPGILDAARVNQKVKRVFTFLWETASVGRQTELARELGVSPARVCQLKKKLADTLAAHGYEPSTGRRAGETPKKRGRPPGWRSRHLDGIPLNAGTSPSRTDV